MTGTEYLKQCLMTDVPSYEPIQERLQGLDPMLIHAMLGIDTEAGEFTDAFKKHILYGKELDRVNLVEELGDMMWYISLALVACDVSYEHVWDRNIAKLKARYPDKFTEERALNRDLKKERKILEQPTSSYHEMHRDTGR